ncbi:Protein of unknown function [Gryllus bimaculatus]|nr:Protein of unknown function [Gryllus bimaculatus]
MVLNKLEKDLIFRKVLVVVVVVAAVVEVGELLLLLLPQCQLQRDTIPMPITSWQRRRQQQLQQCSIHTTHITTWQSYHSQPQNEVNGFLPCLSNSLTVTEGSFSAM